MMTFYNAGFLKVAFFSILTGIVGNRDYRHVGLNREHGPAG